MLQRAFYSTIAALLLSATLVQTAAAYLTDTVDAEVSVTEIYDPLNLNKLTLKDGTNSLNFISFIDFTYLSYEILLSGTFTGVGYPASGPAGDWRLILNSSSESVYATSEGDSLFIYASGPGARVGTLTYEGGLINLPSLPPLPPGDTPVKGDVFYLMSTEVGKVLQVNCADGTTNCNSFDLFLTQSLAHQGPYVGGALDRSRTNKDCLDGEFPDSCGSFKLRASGLEPSAVPEPATLALIGLGLLGLGLSRRTRA